MYLQEDFNIGLSKYNDHTPTKKILDSLVANQFVPDILQPTRITNPSLDGNKLAQVWDTTHHFYLSFLRHVVDSTLNITFLGVCM